jgi:hypothetical protein
VQGASVTRHRTAGDQTVPFGSVYQAGEGGILNTEAAGQVGHASRAGGQDTEELGLHGRQVVAFGDVPEEALHQAREPD